MIRINLIPSKAARKRESGGQQLLAFLILLVLAGGGLFVFYYFTEEDIAAVQNRVVIGQRQLAALRKSTGDLSQYEAREKALREHLGQIETLQKSKTSPVRMLAELSRRIPPRVWLNVLEERDRKMRLSGAALSYDDVSEFVRALRESGYFTNVQYKSQEEKPSPIPGMNFVEFTLQCDSKYAI